MMSHHCKQISNVDSQVIKQSTVHLSTRRASQNSSYDNLGKHICGRQIITSYSLIRSTSRIRCFYIISKFSTCSITYHPVRIKSDSYWPRNCIAKSHICLAWEWWCFGESTSGRDFNRYFRAIRCPTFGGGEQKKPIFMRGNS